MVEARSPGFTIERLEEVLVQEGRVTEIRFVLVRTPTPLDEIVVTPSHFSMLRKKPASSLELGREEVTALPHLFDDLYRAVTVLPGTSGGDISAQFNVRGGLHHELLVELDGIELYEPFHLKDFQGPFTIIDPEMLDAVDLDTGGFPAEYGDRMAGVLDMVSNVPSKRTLGMRTADPPRGSTRVARPSRAHRWRSARYVRARRPHHSPVRWRNASPLPGGRAAIPHS